MKIRSLHRAVAIRAHRRAPAALGALVLLALMAGPASTASAAGRSVAVGAALVPSAEAPVEATGEITILARRKRVELLIEAEGLPAGAYSILVDGAERGVLVMDAPAAGASDPFETVGEARFSTKPVRGGGATLLEFDPAGRVFEIAQSGVSLLTGVAPSVDLFDFRALAADQNLPRQRVRAALSGAPDAGGVVALVSNRRVANLIIRTRGLAPGEHRLIVNGQDAGGFLSKGRRTVLRFSTRPRGNAQPLNFDPTDSAIEIQRNGATVLQATLGGEDLPGLEPIGLKRSPIFATAQAPAAAGEILFDTRDGAMNVTLSIEDAPAGVYEVRLDGVTVGRIAAPGGSGQLRLTRDSLGDGANFISFDPRGRIVQLLLEGRVALGGEVPGVRIGRISAPTTPGAPETPGSTNVTNITNIDNSTTNIDNRVITIEKTIVVNVKPEDEDKDKDRDEDRDDDDHDDHGRHHRHGRHGGDDD